MNVLSMLKRLTSICLIAFTLCLCSCKGDDGTKEIQIPGNTSAPLTPSPDKELNASGKLILPIPENANRKNPYSVTTEEMQTMYSLMFEGLIVADNTGKLVPSLAQNWTRSTEDPSVWSISLRPGVVWHNGENFTAEDVAFSFKTLKNYLASEESSTYYANAANQITSVQVKDELTVDIAMTTNGYASLYALTFPIVCSSTWDSDPQNGTGPYRVTESTSESVTLSVNSSWWRTLPYIQTIHFEERLNNETALASYDAGQLNFVPTSSLSAGRYRQDGVTEVLDIMTQNAEFMLFNHNNPALSDVNVRKAIAYAINRGQIITNVYMNRAHMSDVPIAPDSWLYTAKSKVIEFDASYAKRLLEEAGYRDSDKDGILEKTGNRNTELSFTLLVNESRDNTARRNAADLISQQLKDCGIEITVESENYTLGDAESEYMKRLQEGRFDLVLTGVNIGNDYNLTEMFKTDGKLNYGNVSDARLLELANAMTLAQDESSMRDAAAAFQTAFTENMPFITLYFRLNSIVYSHDIKGISSVREPNITYSVDSWYFGG